MMAILSLLARLVPRGERRDWLAEWRAELADARVARSPLAGSRRRRELLVLLAATEDALRTGMGRLRPAAILRDALHSVRLLRRHPGFTAAAVLTLALGVGANTAIFSVVHALLLRPLDYPDADRIVQLMNVDDDGAGSAVSLLDVEDWAARVESLQDVGYRIGWRPIYQGDEPRRLPAMSVSSGYWKLFATTTALGHFPGPEYDAPGAERVAVLGYAFWQETLGGSPDVVGMSLVLDDVPHTIIGVAPPELRDPTAGARAVWCNPQPYLRTATRSQGWLTAFARLRPGTTLRTAQDEMDAVAAALEQEYPEENHGRRVRLAPLRDRLVGPMRPAALMLLAAVVVLLLIACANIASLLLSRGTARDREMAVRISLGAGHGHLARQLLTESLVLAMAGGIAGAWLGWLAVRAASPASSALLPGWAELRVDGPVLAFTLGVTVLTGLLFGLAPLRQVRRTEVSDVLRESGGGASVGIASRRTRAALAVAEIALATVLAAAAGLLLRSFVALSEVELGLDPNNVLTVTVTPRGALADDPTAVVAEFRRLRERIAVLPGVDDVAQINLPPLTGWLQWYPFVRQDRPAPDPGQEPLAQARTISAGYFRTMGIPLRRGRQPTDGDDWDGTQVAFINDAMASRYFADEDPIGKTIVVYDAPHEIVGVVGDVHVDGPTSAPLPTMYTVHGQRTTPPWLRAAATLVMRTEGDPLALASPVRAAIREVLPDAAVDDLRPLDALLERYRAAPRFQALLVTGFATVATLLAAIGVAGVMSYRVATRAREIGIRRALGADLGDVLGMVLGDVGRLTACGLALGLVSALGASRLLAGLLYGVSAGDPTTFFAVPAVLALVALAAGYVPARRAGRVDPASTLRRG